MAKGVIGHIISKEESPKPEFSPKIDVFISPIGVFSRKNIAMIKELYLGKIIYYLNDKVKKMAKDDTIKLSKITKLILDVYELISNEKVYKSIKNWITITKPNELRETIQKDDFKLYYTVIPFTTVKFENIKHAAEVLNIPLDEKVYIPETKTWTKSPIPVGVTYVQALEHVSEIYSNVRSTGKYQGVTQQATRGKSREGGQSIGNLDINCLLTYNVPSLLQELLTLRSDDHKSKRIIINQIINDGKANIPRLSGKGGTSSLMKILMKGLGLDMSSIQDLNF